MRKFFLALFMILPFLGYSQPDSLNYFIGNNPRFLNQYNDTLPNAFAGGLKNPQFNDLDLNQDGTKDLVVYDGRDHRILPFLRLGNEDNSKTNWVYAPRYEDELPQGQKLMGLLTRDYTKNGKQDLFYVTTSADLAFFKNVSDSTLDFEKVTEAIQSKMPNTQDTLVDPVYAGRTDIPGIADVDSDGDLDILAFNLGGGYLEYYRNYADEVNNPKSDSFYLILEDRCWGCFQESGGSSNIPAINIDCNGFPRIGKQHAGSNILPIEVDNDGDMDIIYGDVGYDNLILMENGRKDYNHPIDSITNASKNYPKNSKPASFEEFLSPFKADVNGDGLFDMVVTTQAEISGKSKNQVWYYENTGSKNKPNFVYQRDDLLQATMFDLGDKSAPVFFDYNADGKQDLLIATSGDYAKTKGNQDCLVLMENIGTKSKPIYEKVNEDYLGLKQDSLIGIKPAIGDLDGDNDKDLLLGKANGQLVYYENQSSSGQKASFTKRTNALDGIDVEQSSSPAIADINGDGKADLLIGSQYKNLYYFKQSGKQNGLPTFTEETDNFGKIGHREYNFITPKLTDLDNNDSLDLILGTKFQGKLLFYFNFKAHWNDTFTTNNELIKAEESDTPKARQLGEYLHPAVNNQDNDSFRDIMVGNSRGGLIFLGSRYDKDTITSPGVNLEQKEEAKSGFKFYPNPVRQNLQIRTVNVPGKSKDISLVIRSIKGRIVKSKHLDAGKSVYSAKLDNLESGSYIAIVKEKDSGRKLKQEKIIIMD